jgi:hypothetical protein
VVGMETNGPNEDPYGPVGASIDAARGADADCSRSLAGVKLGLRPRFARRCRGSLDPGEASGSLGN